MGESPVFFLRSAEKNLTSWYPTSSVISESVRFAFKNPLVSRNFVKQHAQELDDDVIDKHISLFVNEHTISLGEEGQQAVERLLSSSIAKI